MHFKIGVILIFGTLFSCSKGKSEISYDKVYVEVNDSLTEKVVYKHGDKVVVKFKNVTGLIESGGKVFPGISLSIKNLKEGNVVFQIGDQLAHLDEGVSVDTLNLMTSFNATYNRLKSNEYEMTVRIWDKIGDKEVSFVLPFEVIKNERINIQNKELFYSEIYLWNQSEGYMLSNDISMEDKNVLIIEGLTGFLDFDGMVYPSIELSVIDSNGQVVIDSGNLFKNKGFPAEALRERIPLTLTFDHAKFKNPCNLILTITDLKRKERYIRFNQKIVIK